MKVIGITGLKNTGKTTLITKLISELKNRGYEVGTVKKTHSTFDLIGRDTEKHSSAGASVVVGSGEETFFKINEKIDLENIINYVKKLKNIDFLLLEGFKESSYIKIATANYGEDETIIKNVDVNSLEKKDVVDIVSLIEKRSYGQLKNLNCKKCGYNTCNEFKISKIKGEADNLDCFSDDDLISLVVDDSSIPMNPFVQKLVRNIITSLSETLRTSEFGAEDFEKIEITVKN